MSRNECNFKGKIKILNADDVSGIMQRILLRENKVDRDKEYFWIIGLNVPDKRLFIELVCIGGTQPSTIEPMTVCHEKCCKENALFPIPKGAFYYVLHRGNERWN